MEDPKTGIETAGAVQPLRQSDSPHFAGTGNQRLLTDAVLAVEAGVYGLGLGELPDGSGTGPSSQKEVSSSDPVPSESDPPIFTLGRVQYAFPAPLERLAVSNNVMVMCLSATRSAAPRLVRIDLDNPGQVEQVFIPPISTGRGHGHSSAKQGAYKLFLDPSGTHVLLSHPATAQMHWWVSGWKRVRSLSKAHHHRLQVHSVAWSPQPNALAATPHTTGPLLVGTRGGEIWETQLAVSSRQQRSHDDPLDFLDIFTRRAAGPSAVDGEVEKYWSRVFSLPLPEPVTGLSTGFCAATSLSSRTQAKTNAWVIATTLTRIYEFVGPLGTSGTDSGPFAGAVLSSNGDAQALAAQVNDGGLSTPPPPSSMAGGQGQRTSYQSLFALYCALDGSGEGDAARCLRTELPAPTRPEFSALSTWFPISTPSKPESRGDEHMHHGLRDLHLVPDPVSDSKADIGSTPQIAWLVQPGVYHGALLGNDKKGQVVVDHATLFPFPSTPVGRGAEEPIALAQTQFHTVLLFPGRENTRGGSISDERATAKQQGPRVVCTRTVDDTTVFTAPLGDLMQPQEEVKGIASDPIQRTVWVYTSGSIFELVLANEGRHVWRALLHHNKFSQALRLAPTRASQEAVVAAQADRLVLKALGLARPERSSRAKESEMPLSKKRNLIRQAAGLYAQSSVRPFEKMVLALAEADASTGELPEGGGGGVRTYLSARLERTPRSARLARTMLATWLLEAQIAFWNELEDAGAAQMEGGEFDQNAQQVKEVDQAISSLLRSHADVLPRNTVYDLARQHARPTILLQFAIITRDHTTRVRWHLDHGEYLQALHVLAQQDDLQLYYTSATTLLSNVPLATVEAWKREVRLDPRRLLPALLLYRPLVQREGQESGENAFNPAIDYLRFVARAGNTDLAVHNTLIALLAQGPETSLVEFVDATASAPRYDLAYALRVSLGHHQRVAATHLYTLMGRHADAVALALEGNEVQAACSAAEAAPTAEATGEGDMLCKSLWLKIARHVVEGQGNQEKQNVALAMGLVERSGCLSIEDVLPFFPDFVVMDAFKSQVTEALHAHATRLTELRQALDNAAQSAERAQEQTKAVQSTRFVTLHPQTQRCIGCAQSLLQNPQLFENAVTRTANDQFFTFVCGHAWHVGCLVRAVAQRASRHTRRSWATIHARLAQLSQEVVPRLPHPIAWPLDQGTWQALVVGLCLLLPSEEGKHAQAQRDHPDEDDILGTTIGRRKAQTPSGGPMADGPSSLLADVPPEDEARLLSLRNELEALVAAACPACAAAVVEVDAPLDAGTSAPWPGDWE